MLIYFRPNATLHQKGEYQTKIRVAVFVRMCKDAQQAMCLIQRHANVCAMEGFPRRPFMTDFVNANKSRELGLSKASRRKLHLAITMFNCMLPSPHLIYLSFFLHLHPTTTPAPPHLPSSTFHPWQSILLWTKVIQFRGHSTVAIPAKEDPRHQRPLETSLDITHSASNNSINDI